MYEDIEDIVRVLDKYFGKFEGEFENLLTLPKLTKRAKEVK